MKSKSIFWVALFALVLAGIACSPGGGAQATAQALSESLNATGTAQAANNVGSAAVVQTAQAEATAAAEGAVATQTARAVEDSANAAATESALAPIKAELPTYGVDPSEGTAGWIHPPIELEVEGYLQVDYRNNFIGTLVSDFVVSADITWDTDTGLAGCGFVVRSDGDEEAFNQYLTIITRGANGSIGFLKQVEGEMVDSYVPQVRGLDWQNGATNNLTVVARGPEISFYTNGAFAQSFNAPEFDRGFVAMVALSESGTTHCEFNNAWMWILKE